MNIWNKNTSREFLDSCGLQHYKEGDMGCLYGYNFLHYGYPYEGCNVDYTDKGYNQIKYIIETIKHDPTSRRILFTSFNPSVVDEGCLWPCHSIVVQFYLEADNKLSCQVYNRSQDMFLGCPFNIASAALQLILFTELINNDLEYNGEKLTPGRLIMSLGDCHIYENHIEAVMEQINRRPYAFPKLVINKVFRSFDELNYEDITLVDYQCHDTIRAEMIA